VTVPDPAPTPGFEGATIPAALIPDDDGQVSPALRHELDELASGRGSGQGVLRALSRARLFVPVVAVLDDESINTAGLRHEKQSSMATVLVDSPDHGRALLAFSSLESLTTWRQDARPVATAAPLAARAAIGEAVDALLVDVAGPTPFALDGNELLLMAAVARAADPTTPDPVVIRAVERILSSVAPERAAGLELHSTAPDQPAQLTILGVATGHDRDALVGHLSRDRVINRLLPQGLRVRFRDTP
jgi:hypothetical protein